MTQDFFNKQMQFIIDDFGPAEYPTHKMRIIWEQCGDLPPKNFAWIVQHFLRSRSVKYPPLPDHFIEAAIEQRKHLREPKPQLRTANELEPVGRPLNEILADMGANNVIEAMQLFRSKTKNGNQNQT